MEFLSNLFGIVFLLLLVAVGFGALMGVAWLWVRFRGWMFLIFGVTFVVFAAGPPSELATYLVIALFTMFVSGALAGLGLVVGDVQRFGDKVSGRDRLHDHDGVWHDHPHDGWHYHPQGRADTFIYIEKQEH